jgi:hypothetical protein
MIMANNNNNFHHQQQHQQQLLSNNLNKNPLVPGIGNVGFYFDNVSAMTANGNLASMNNTAMDQLRMQQTTNPMNTINTMNSNLGNMASNMQPGMNIPGTGRTLVGNNINNNTTVGMVDNNNYKRLMDMNKNALLNPFGTFGTYPTTVGDINRIPIPPQFSNQISFNMPPPGGISYMIPPGYPYNFSNSILANRFPPSSSTLPNPLLENQNQ